MVKFFKGVFLSSKELEEINLLREKLARKEKEHSALLKRFQDACPHTDTHVSGEAMYHGVHAVVCSTCGKRVE